MGFTVVFAGFRFPDSEKENFFPAMAPGRVIAVPYPGQIRSIREVREER